MPPPTVPLKELTTAVQSAVQQVLAKHGAVDVGHLWVGFVAPDAIANEANALQVAQALGKGAGVAVQPSVAQLAATGAAPAAAGALPIPPKGHIIGLIYSPR
jgi:hypothetical protein